MFSNREALEDFYKATAEFRDTVKDNYVILLQAGQTCAETMGNDAVSMRYLEQLASTLKYLDKALEEIDTVLGGNKAYIDDFDRV